MIQVSTSDGIMLLEVADPLPEGVVLIVNGLVEGDPPAM
jgi:hypothetical protein